MFFALMVGTPRSPVPPPRGGAIDIFCFDGGRSRISDTASHGAAISVFCIDGGLSKISDTVS
jgi:hypothetical protein